MMSEPDLMSTELNGGRFLMTRTRSASAATIGQWSTSGRWVSFGGNLAILPRSGESSIQDLNLSFQSPSQNTPSPPTLLFIGPIERVLGRGRLTRDESNLIKVVVSGATRLHR